MSAPPKDNKSTILARIREALSIKTDPHVKGYGLAATHSTVSADAPNTTWLPPVGPTRQEQIDLFRRYSDKLRTRFEVVSDLPAAVELVCAAAREESWQRVGAHHDPLVEACINTLGLEVCWTDDTQRYDPDALEACDGGITTCEALIAQTGSVLVTCQSNGGRALSVLPPHHIVLATADQMLPDLTAGYRALLARHGDRPPSQVSLITGPSRTSDIERTLVMGAHGPKKLTVILIDAD